MASPVFHGWVGAGLAYVAAGDARLPLWTSLHRSAPLLMAAVVLACLPDIDYLPGIWSGSLNAMHQQGTHSVAWVLLASAVLWGLGRWWKPAAFGWRTFLFIVLLIGSHLVIDLFTADGAEPYGIPLWAPLSAQHVQGPVALLPAWEKSTLGEVWCGANLRPLAIEMGAGMLVAAGCLLVKRSWTRRAAGLSCPS